jgi:N-acetylmuramoyl-L-alanine amidase CwlA
MNEQNPDYLACSEAPNQRERDAKRRSSSGAPASLAVLLLALLLCTVLLGCVSSAPPALAAGKRGEVVRNGVPIKVMLLDDNAYNRQYKLPGPMREVKHITIHNTANSASAKAERDYLNRRQDKVYISFHYAVDELGAVQIMRHDQQGWHAGDGRKGSGNCHSIAIEICRSTSKDRELYAHAEENAVKLAAWLLKIHRLGVEDLRTHKDWSGKNCPHRILNEKRWPQFKQRVQKAMPR